MDSPDKKKNYYPSESFGAKFYELTPKSWGEAKEIGNKLEFHVFRGHSDSSWPLSTTLERVARRFNCPPKELWSREKYILKIFKSRAHQFLNSPPKYDEIVEWLSIIQDFGGPTRLLDFTESFFIASFFALESASDEACVWAISNMGLRLMPNFISVLEPDKINLKQDTMYDFDAEEILRYAESFVLDISNEYDLVLRVTPPRLNERLATQKGLFLFSCNLLESFENNLCRTFGFPFRALIPSNAIHDNVLDKHDKFDLSIVKINLPKDLHADAIKDLHSMNVDATSLFPGLDGFARSLNYTVQFPPFSFKTSIKLSSQ